MAEKRMILKGGKEELELLEKAKDYYNTILPKYWEIKGNNTIDLILRHPEKDNGFSLPDKKRYNIEDILEQIENVHQKSLNRGIDHTSPNHKNAYLSAYSDYIAKQDNKVIINSKKNIDTDDIISEQNQVNGYKLNALQYNTEVERLKEISKTANEGYNPYESYLALKEKAEEKGLTIFLSHADNFQIPHTNEDALADVYAEYYREDKKLPVFSAIAIGDGKTKTFREENYYNDDRSVNGRIYISNDYYSSDMETIKDGLGFAIARANNQERNIRNITEKALTDDNMLYTVSPFERDKVIEYTKSHSDLTPKPLNPQDLLAISDAFAREMTRDNKILETGMSNDQLSEMAEKYYNAYQEKEQQEFQEQNLKTYEIVKNGTIQGEVRAENKDEAYIVVAERYGEENFNLIEKEPEIRLYENDWVVLNEKDEFIKFDDGQIIIYSNEEDAIADKAIGDSIVNVFDLTEEQQQELKENIAEYSGVKLTRKQIDGNINEIAGKTLSDKNYLYLFDEGIKNTIEAYLKTKPNLEPIELDSKDYLAISNVFEKEKNLGIELSSEKREKIVSLYYELYQAKEKQELNQQNMETQQPAQEPTQSKKFDVAEYLNNQMKYLGFGDNYKETIQKHLDTADKSFQIQTTSDRVMEGNKVDFAVNFNKSEKGGVFLNSFDARLITQDGEERSHNFKLNFTAKEAINLLEGRAVKTEFNNSKTNEPFESFVRLKFNEPKNEYDNYKLEFHKANEIDTAKIVELSGLKFEKPEYKDFVVKSLEKGNITNVKFTHEGNEIEGKAVLNPQYKNLNLYDKDMNRLNTNKPLQGLEQDNSHEKNNVRQQNISRSI